MAGLAEAARRWAASTEHRMQEVVRGSLAKLVDRLDAGAPILTGQFIFNWQITPDTPAEGMYEEFEPSRPGARLKHKEEIATLPISQVYFVVNNTPYASWIEYEHRTAAGHVRRVLLEWGDIVDGVARSIQ